MAWLALGTIGSFALAALIAAHAKQVAIETARSETGGYF